MKPDFGNPMHDDLLPETLAALSRQFGLSSDDRRLTTVERASLEDVKRFLVEKITDLLDRNPALLMSILYRIDVAEPDVKRVLSHAAPEAIPSALADLLITRQLQKIRFRRSHDTY